jgi:type IV pilus assembly protein PilC
MVRAAVEAASRSDALAVLRRRDLTVVDLRPAAEGARAQSASARRQGGGLRLPSRRVPTTEMAVFCRQVAISIGSGVPLRDAVASIAEDLDHPVMSSAVNRVVSDLDGGASFSQALDRHPSVFSPLIVSLARSAEESGSMPETLDQLSVYLERSDRLERKIKSITAYPLFVACFFCLVCAVMTLWILPRFEDIFAGYEAKTPWLTKAVFGANRLLLDHLLLLGAGAGGLALAFLAYRRSARGRMRLDRLKLRLPLFGPLLGKFAVARSARNLAMMVRGGVPIAEAFRITAGVAGNTVLEQAMLRARQRMIDGSPVAASLAEDPAFPRLLVRMTAVGEESGQMPEVLEKISNVYEEQVEGTITVATALFEPLVIILFGAVILVLILAIYMPVFTMGASVH